MKNVYDFEIAEANTRVLAWWFAGATTLLFLFFIVAAFMGIWP